MYIDTYGGKRLAFDSAAPTVGTWNVGDRCVNNAPAAGEPNGWVCVAAGTPGTWVPEAPLSQSTVNDIQVAVVTVTNAQIKALRATPKTLVAAPGASKYLQLIGASVFLDAGTNVLTESADNLAIKYENGSGAAASDTIETTGFIDSATDAMVQAVPIKDVVMAANKALVLHNIGDGEFAGNAANDATLKVFVTYKVISVA